MASVAQQNLMNRYGIFSESTRSNPQALYARIRAEEPVFKSIGPFSGNTFWFLTRYEDCITALKHPQIGKEIKKHLPPEILANYPEPSGPLAMIDRHLLSIDPPDHTRLRSLIHKVFTPMMVENLRPRIKSIANELLDKVEQNGEMDLITDYGFPLPIIVIAELLGVPASDREQFRYWTQQFMFGTVEQTVTSAAMEFLMYMNAMIEDRRIAPRDDLLSGLVNAKEEGSSLDHQELLSMIFLLLVAGHETTVNLIGNGTLALLQNPSQLKLLRGNRSLIKSAVEEMLRYNGPVETTTFRWAFEDVKIGDTIIPAGDIVVAALLAANRDPEVFSNPDTFDITRDPNRHIAFGNGIHFCVGAPLARLEGAIAIDALLERLPELHLESGVEDTVKWNDSILLHGMKALPVKF